MCIRDSPQGACKEKWGLVEVNRVESYKGLIFACWDETTPCLLYTSDAADERSSVDLGGRRIIKKKKARANVTTNLGTRQNTLNRQRRTHH